MNNGNKEVIVNKQSKSPLSGVRIIYSLATNRLATTRAYCIHWSAAPRPMELSHSLGSVTYLLSCHITALAKRSLSAKPNNQSRAMSSTGYCPTVGYSTIPNIPGPSTPSDGRNAKRNVKFPNDVGQANSNLTRPVQDALHRTLTNSKLFLSQGGRKVGTEGELSMPTREVPLR